MHDLTQGSIRAHLVRMAVPMAIGMIFQTLYYLVDLYFVGQLGDAAIAGVSAAGNVQFIIMALTQVLGVGTTVLISHAAGRKDRADGTLIFNQSLVMAMVAAAITLVGGYGLGHFYLSTLAADAATLAAGKAYLYWFLPALALQFAVVSIGSALRGTGIAKPTMIVQILTVVLNAILAPILITGWGTGRPMGVAGAALASTIAVTIAVAVLLIYFVKLEHFVGLDRTLLKPHWPTWKRVLAIGVPAGGEFLLLFVTIAINYLIIGRFGAAAQAGFGVGQRMMQSIFLPSMAIAFSASPIAGQNLAAGRPERAREAFMESIKLSTMLMLVSMAIAKFRPEWLVGAFASDPETIAVAAMFLRIISWNFIASGILFTCSGMFQAMGNTVPTVIASAVRLTLFAVPAFWVASRPGFHLDQLWHVSVAATTVHVCFTLWLLDRTVKRRRIFAPAPVPAAAPA